MRYAKGCEMLMGRRNERRNLCVLYNNGLERITLYIFCPLHSPCQVGTEKKLDWNLPGIVNSEEEKCI